ncbi:MAG TPA: hypothetical protein VG537_02620 [Candidatus Kapabacteria bacterium]|jgi:uncharacterized protein YyaL (SSP411 family)|nr:hypothetical protein [Candidatus Kapabacteria bacterium]
MKRTFASWTVLASLLLLGLTNSNARSQKKIWQDDLLATNAYMQQHLWNANTGNFIRRADMPGSAGSDSWGITIVLDAYAYMVQEGYMKPDELKKYYQSSSSLYEKTNGTSGARILVRQGNQIYVGGDDDMQWSAALVHCYDVTKDSEYLQSAKSAFNALIDLGFWKNGTESANDAKGWAWNSSDERPNGVSTAYGALAAARLYRATGENVYRQWVIASLNALETPQVGFFPRDMMVAANAAITTYEVSHEPVFRARAIALAKTATTQVHEIISGKRAGERNPTDVGDLAEGFFHLATAIHDKSYPTQAFELIHFFLRDRTPADIIERGFYSRYDSTSHPDMNGSYLGVPLSVPFLPEVAEMLKLCAAAIE